MQSLTFFIFTVTSLKYLGSVITDEGSKPERLSRTAQTTAALTRLKPVWNYRSISLSSKIPLMYTFVTSIFLCACESWTLTAELQRRTQAMEMIIWALPILLQDTVAHDDASPYQFHNRSQKLRRYHQDEHSLEFWTFSVTLTSTITEQSNLVTIQLLLMCHQIKFSCNRFSSSEDIRKVTL